MYVVVCLFFFFKQKTAYEMRISDWSSDVCSSDLRPARRHQPGPRSRGCGWHRAPDARAIAGDYDSRGNRLGAAPRLRARQATATGRQGREEILALVRLYRTKPQRSWCRPRDRTSAPGPPVHRSGMERAALQPARRSEEHTSELPSLLRISYAVFCL